MPNPPKITSYEYGRAYQLNQAEKYRQRNSNHWKPRIALAHHLVDQYALPGLSDDKQLHPVVLDIGCSIGTFAIEFAKKGYTTYGVDFDSSALVVASELAKEEQVSPVFIQGDITNLDMDLPPIDLAICFDIFEHLHDDELGALLISVKKRMSEDGSLVFHTCPTQYEYIFYGYPFIRFPLIPFSRLSQDKFNIVVKIYTAILEIALLLRKGKTYREKKKRSPHCNPTTLERLSDIFHHLGYEIVFIETSNLYELTKPVAKYFSRQPISYYNLYGVVRPTANGSID